MRISELAKTCTFSPEPLGQVDIIVSGGGLRAVYAYGVMYYLLQMKRSGCVRFGCFYGASAGAICSVLMAADVDPDVAISHIDKMYEEARKHGYPLSELARRILRRVLPSDAHVRCTGRTYITLRHFPDNWFKSLTPVVVSNFDSVDDLIDATVASCSAPFATTQEMGVMYRGQRVMDGMFPHLTDDFGDRRALYVDLYKLNPFYSLYHTLKPTDDCIYTLVVRGLHDAEKFFVTTPGVSSVRQLRWIDQTSDYQSIEHTGPTFLTLAGLWAIHSYATVSGHWFEVVEKSIPTNIFRAWLP